MFRCHEDDVALFCEPPYGGGSGEEGGGFNPESKRSQLTTALWFFSLSAS